MALKALEVKAFQPQTKVYRKADEKGLYIEVSPSGSKLWRMKYRFNGTERRLALGAYPEVSLADAREKRDAARKLLRDGIDPGHERKLSKVAAKVAAGNSFQSVAEDFIETKLVKARKAEPTIEKARWYLSHLTPSLGSRPISEIEPAELLVVLKKIESAGKRETARRTRALASRIFRFGVATARCKTDPAGLLGDALAAPIVRHHAAILDPKLLGDFLRAIDGYGGGPIVKIALRLAPHLFMRPGELRQGLWHEIDWENRTWNVPAERMKRRRPHGVPLSRQSLALLKELQLHSGGFERMFPGQRSHLRPMSENTMNAAYRRLGFDKDTVTSHGLRSTASTLLNESGKWHPDAIERGLSHGDSNTIRGIYARGQFWEERIEMAQWWSDYLDQVKGNTTVIPFRKSVSDVTSMV